jgi:hypothetical protein
MSYLLGSFLQFVVRVFLLSICRHRRTLKAPNLPGELVDDACLLQAGNSYLVVLGHAREQAQLSCYRIPIDLNQVRQILWVYELLPMSLSVMPLR